MPDSVPASQSTAAREAGAQPKTRCPLVETAGLRPDGRRSYQSTL
jgi:hypothetical protein